jgi:hypothetical protein
MFGKLRSAPRHARATLLCIVFALTTGSPAAPASVEAGPEVVFAVQLRAGRGAEAPLALPDLPELGGARPYTVPFRKDGAWWTRQRVGFFASRAAAERAAAALARDFPGAFVVEAPPGERQPALAQGAAPAASAKQAPAPRTPPPPAAAPDAGAGRLVEEARAALAAGDAPRAIVLLSAALTRPQGEATAEARELLGVARERSGQLAHARAEYETYLREHPDGEGAVRVRQRLEALDTARAEPVAQLRGGRDAADRRARLRGSFATYYRRFEFVGDDHTTSDSYLLGHLTLRGDALTERVDLRAEADASYFLGLGHDTDEARVRSLYVAVDDRAGPLSASLGRHGLGASQILGRFDGARLGYGFAEGWRLSAVAGYLVDLYAGSGVATDRPFYGVTLEGLSLAERVDLQLFAVQERADGYTDGTSVGGEMRYSGERLFLSGFLDYDTRFGALDALVVNGSWQASDATTLNVFVDHRYVPSLALRNALIGQPLDSLSALDQQLRFEDLEGVARDRSARSTLASLGATHRLSERFLLAGDFAVSELSGTPSSAGVEGFEGTGLEYWAMLELIGSELALAGDTGILGLRYVAGEDRDRAALLLDWRVPIAKAVRAGPRVIVEYRSAEGEDARVHVRPGAHLEYRIGSFTIDAEVELEWAEGELARSLLLGARYDF